MHSSTKASRPSSKSSTDENTTPSESPVLPLSPIALKEVRRWDHDTRRFKKRVDFLGLKESKELSKFTRYGMFKPRYLAWAGSAEYDEHLASKEPKVDLKYHSPSVRWRPHSPEQDDGTAERIWKQNVPSLRPEVPLTDLLTPRKPRHQREPDFEVVPPVRSVIALDDATVPDVDINEPWEQVDTDGEDVNGHPDGRDGSQPSYANIVGHK